MAKKIKTGLIKKKNRFNILKTDEEFSKSILLNVPQIILTGDKGVLIEGNMSIVEYNESLVKIMFKNGCITFLGEEIIINTFLDSKISFTGKISSIEFS